MPQHQLRTGDVVRGQDSAGVVHTFTRATPTQAPRSSRRQFATNVALYLAAACGVGLVILVPAGLTGGPWGLFAFSIMLGIALLVLIPGALIATGVLTWLLRRDRPPSSLGAGLTVGGISALWLIAVLNATAIFSDLGSDPADSPTISRLFVGLGAVIGGLAGVAIRRTSPRRR